MSNPATPASSNSQPGRSLLEFFAPAVSPCSTEVVIRLDDKLALLGSLEIFVRGLTPTSFDRMFGLSSQLKAPSRSLPGTGTSALGSPEHST